jgi:hypothetical protein
MRPAPMDQMTFSLSQSLTIDDFGLCTLSYLPISDRITHVIYHDLTINAHPQYFNLELRPSLGFLVITH